LFRSRYSAVKKLGDLAVVVDPQALDPANPSADDEDMINEEVLMFEDIQFDGITTSEKVDTALGLIQNQDMTIVDACKAVGITRSAFRW
jgi:hypothetical protein